MRTLALTLVFALGLGGAAIAQSPMPMPMPSTASPSAAPAAPSPGTATKPMTATVVHIKNFAFNPSSVTVAVGQPVRFVEDDETPHTVTASDKSFDSGNLNQGQSWTHTFEKAGTYAYICAYHPYMKGTITVK